MPQSTKDLRYANKYLFLFSLEATEAPVVMRGLKYCNLVLLCRRVFKKGKRLLARVIQLEKPSSWKFTILIYVCKKSSAGSGSAAMCVNKGQPICETPACEKGPVNNLNHSIGATWHVPGKKICVSKLPMHKSSIQSCLQL